MYSGHARGLRPHRHRLQREGGGDGECGGGGPETGDGGTGRNGAGRATRGPGGKPRHFLCSCGGAVGGQVRPAALPVGMFFVGGRPAFPACGQRARQGPDAAPKVAQQ